MRVVNKETEETLRVYYRSDITKIDFDTNSGEIIISDIYGGKERYLNAYIDLA